jgi:MtN3 and saliva related transmembrane protein
MTAIETAAAILGWLGNILVCMLNLPQMIQTVKTRSTKDLNIWTYIILTVVLLSLFVYGILIGEYPIIIGNIISFVIMSPILVLKATEKRREREDVVESEIDKIY